LIIFLTHVLVCCVEAILFLKLIIVDIYLGVKGAHFVILY